MSTAYADFIASKGSLDLPTGIEPPALLNGHLFDWQADIVRWALRRGRAAIFADCGLGKTLMQLEWASHVPGRVLVLAPLAVAHQTVAEGAKFGIEVEYRRHDLGRAYADGDPKIIIANYEMLDHFEPSNYDGVVLDESSILKAYGGKTRNAIIDAFRETPFKLACTATPAPNDFMELGNHSEFLGVMKRMEMLSMFFVHDGGSTKDWRVKGHARGEFWRWVASWAVQLRKPSDLGYPDEGFDLPPLSYHDHVIPHEGPNGDFLFPVEAHTLQERLGARRDSIADRVAKAAEIVNASDEPWVVWCALNAESEALAKAIDGAVEVRGADTDEKKESRLRAFASGDARVIVTKPKIAGFGLNWQHCPNMAFVGLSDSWEQYYQATRRCWRFGQESPVHVHVISSELEGAVVRNIQRKEKDAAVMAEEMVTYMSDINRENVRGVSRDSVEYETDTKTGRDWTMHLGDCVEVVRGLGDESIDFSVFSPPFASLYTYSASDRDMGNCSDTEEFMDHFRFLVDELFRVLKPGRNVSFHCMLLPTSKQAHGQIGLRDFRGEIIAMFVAAGFIHHSEVVIWKDPVTAMQRTKALGLLHKQIKKDSCMSRQGVPDYLITMRKPGENPERVGHTNESFPVSEWQKLASPVWMDINPSETLQFRSARENDDERHICPLQLEVIRRALKLWTNEGDLVLSPFAGIGSEGHVSLEQGRRFVGAELKRSYFSAACKNLSAAETMGATLFDLAESAE